MSSTVTGLYFLLNLLSSFALPSSPSCCVLHFCELFTARRTPGPAGRSHCSATTPLLQGWQQQAQRLSPSRAEMPQLGWWEGDAHVQLDQWLSCSHPVMRLHLSGRLLMEQSVRLGDHPCLWQQPRQCQGMHFQKMVGVWGALVNTWLQKWPLKGSEACWLPCLHPPHSR